MSVYAKLTVVIILALAVLPGQHAAMSQTDSRSIKAPGLLGAGINFGNALEAPAEGEWGLVLREQYFDLVKEAGFKTVRLPVSWAPHASTKPPYVIDSNFFNRVDWACNQAVKRGLNVIVNVHHYDELNHNPEREAARYLAIWKQIAERYRSQPPGVYFELLNEPHDGYDKNPQKWNEHLMRALDVVRQSNPDRGVIIGPVAWNSIGSLEKLAIPANDEHLIVTVHYYLPFEFTHQGADWVEGSNAWLGTKWTGTPQEKAAVRADLDKALNFARKQNRQLLLGEFGAYSKAKMDSRIRWTGFVRSEAEKRGISWAYWEFGSGFGVYDPKAKRWRVPLLQSLIPDSALAR